MIETVHLFPELDRQLLSLLHSLTPADWNRMTIAKKWTVKDIAAHLLDGNIRMLSIARDNYLLPPDRNINSYEELVSFLNDLNAEWTKAFKRVSPNLLTELLEITGKKYSEFISTLDPYAKAVFSVAWAGETESQNWFHIAREYTEKWHHQKQIRDAVGVDGLMSRELFFPFIDTMLIGMPHNLRAYKISNGSAVKFIVDSEIGGAWTFTRKDDKWIKTGENEPNIVSTVIMQPEDAWKLFTKGKRPEDLNDQVQISGDKSLAFAALSMIAVMA